MKFFRAPTSTNVFTPPTLVVSHLCLPCTRKPKSGADFAAGFVYGGIFFYFCGITFSIWTGFVGGSGGGEEGHRGIGA